jgi:2-dehydropantoate 2-reductase
MEIVVFGAGSLGSLIGGLLAREHDVTLVGRDPHVSVVRRSGLDVGGAFEFTVRPDARTDLSAFSSTADLGVVTVKAFDTEAAARALSGRVETVLSLQNGMGNEQILGTELDRVLAGTCTYGAVLREPGVVNCTGRGEVVCGPFGAAGSETSGETDRSGPADRADRAGSDDRGDHGDHDACEDRCAAERVGNALRSAGIEATVAEDMADRLWEKLAVNAGINPVTALARVPNGALRSGNAHELAVRAARETARVAREGGVDLADGKAVAALEGVIETTAANESSMLQDVRAVRRTEIDAISGHVADRAIGSVPVTETLRDLVRAWERGQSLR